MSPEATVAAQRMLKTCAEIRRAGYFNDMVRDMELVCWEALGGPGAIPVVSRQAKAPSRVRKGLRRARKQ